MPPQQSVLLFSSIGDAPNLTRAWCDRDALGTDTSGLRITLVTGYYGDSDSVFDALRDKVDVAFRFKGSKWQSFHHYYTTLAVQPAHDFYAIFDDDIEFSPAQMVYLLERAVAYAATDTQAVGFSPAHCSTGKTSYRAFFPVTGSTLRRAPFIEMGWPIFTGQFLRDYMEVYSPSLISWGIDIWYSMFAASRGQYFYVIDAIPARNPFSREKGLDHDEMLTNFPDEEAAWKEFIASVLVPRGITEEMCDNFMWQIRQFNVIDDIAAASSPKS